MNDFNFSSMDLSAVEAQGPRTLSPGIHPCKIAEAKIEPTKDKKGRKLVVKFIGVNSPGYVTDFINISLPGKEVATRIGLERLKSLLVAAGHPNPNQPGDIKSLVGLTVNVSVMQGDDWTDGEGKLRKGGGQVEDSGNAYTKFAPSMGTTSGAPAAAPAQDSFSDDIPF